MAEDVEIIAEARPPTQEEALEIFRKMLTRIRELQLEKLKAENAVLRAQILLKKFYQPRK